ncbi:phosphodiester glycosidase family protein [Negadavirga shengliensis]|uniref:Phosphodiester glycosidase family protein n=1 Tax=Negadavirga shengliensis TaxID=1389218 RepID=A0ABV9T6K3_9BACT
MNNLKSILLPGFLFFIQTILFAQQADSVAVVTQNWKATPIKKGVVWKQGHFDDLFQSQQEINFVEIDIRKYRKRIRIAADPAQLKKTSRFAAENQAIVAINGGFFDMKNGGAVDYVKVGGKTINTTQKETDRADAVLMLSKKASAIQPGSAINYQSSDFPDILLSGPLLVQDGRDMALTNNPFNDNRHPRSAVALTADKKLILIVVDGRNRLAQGMRLDELAKTLRWLGAQDAMNLDGGGSSTLFVKGATENNIVNHPSDNKTFDHEGERSVANIIYLR